MSQMVTLEVPEQVASHARRIATMTQRRLEDVLLEWLDRSAAELPVQYLSNEQILALTTEQLPQPLQNELSALLAKNRERLLQQHEQARLDALMTLYRQGMVRKAESLRVAVERKLIAPLN
ncbi:MAG: hypothetical protein HY328_16555 [Chloroflexi bacterium]|nr:hypothetical protein [Chloroflexota bacterium]